MGKVRCMNIYTLLDSIHVKFQKQQNKAMVPEVKIVAIGCRVVNYSKGTQKGF